MENHLKITKDRVSVNNLIEHYEIHQANVEFRGKLVEETGKEQHY